MRIPIFQVDAFTTEVFRGNPAAVCPLDSWIEDTLMQAIAAENNLSETAFFVSAKNGREEGRFELRWFTPKMEVDLCGHATLASAHVIFRHLGYDGELVRFETRSGELAVTRKGELLAMDFPSRPGASCPVPEGLIAGLGAVPEEVYLSRDYLAVFGSDRVIEDIHPDFEKLSRLDCLGIIITAPGTRSDFVSRFFAPRAGVPEDPVTGSAHCTLIPYWSSRLGKKELFALQVSGRGGELYCTDRGDRVKIAGRAVTYLEGAVLV